MALLLPAVASADYPRAELARNAQHAAIAANAALNEGFAPQLTQALGGSAAREALLRLLANFSAAIDAPEWANEQWEQAAAIAHRRGNARAEAAILVALARSAIVLGEYDEALAFAEREAILAQRRGDLSAEAAAENIRGVVARRRGHLDAALAHQERSLALCTSDANTVGAMRALADLGTIWRDRGDYARALEAQLDAAEGSEESGNRLEIIYRNIALLYREIEDAPAARDYFQRALDLAARHGVPSVYSSIMGSYAGLLNDLGEYANARDAAEEAFAIDSARGDRPHQGFEHVEIGRALLGLGRPDEAISHLEQGLQIGRAIGQREISAPALLHLAKAAINRNDRLHARTLIDEAIAGLETARLRPQLAQAYALREQLAITDRDDATALRFSHKRASTREELLGIRASRQVAALEARHARALAQERLALVKSNNELDLAKIKTQTVEWRLGLIASAGLLLALLAMVWRYRVARKLNGALDLRNTKIERQRMQLAEANATLRMQAEQLSHAATTDALTGVLNRRGLLQALGLQFDECRQLGEDLAVMLIDFDHFKLINDRRGHLVGDQALIAGTRVMQTCLDRTDVLGRFGGEEFVAMIRGRAAAHVFALGERIRATIAADLRGFSAQPGTPTTVSIGIAFLSDLPPTGGVDDLIEAADRRLYQGKNTGRNQVVHDDSARDIPVEPAL